jgi:MYXO-CTERM domain-containing protein
LYAPFSETPSNTLDISTLSQLQNLEWLSVSSTRVESFETIGELKKLTNLTLSYCGLTDITGLERLQNLRIVRIWNNDIGDLTPFAGLTNIEMLVLDANRIEDVTPLSKLPNLSTLHLNNNNIEDISPLNQLPALEGLQVDENHITDISSFENLFRNGRLELLQARSQTVELPDVKAGSSFENPVRNLDGSAVDLPQFASKDDAGQLIAPEEASSERTLYWNADSYEPSVGTQAVFFSGEATLEVLPADPPPPEPSPFPWATVGLAGVAAVAGIVWWRRRRALSDNDETNQARSRER